MGLLSSFTKMKLSEYVVQNCSEIMKWLSGK